MALHVTRNRNLPRSRRSGARVVAAERQKGHYSLVSEWFRSHDWSTDAQQDFETRLGRARAHNRAQYLRIKALALIDAGNLDAATALLHRVVDDYGDDWIQVTASHEHLGDIYRSKGDLAGAETEYRRVLMLSPNLSGTTGEVHLKLGEVLLAAGTGDFAEIELLLAAARPYVVFNTSAYRANLLDARVAAAVGDVPRRRASAAAALGLLNAPPQFGRHPTVGLVDASPSLLAEIADMAGEWVTPTRRRFRRT
jgi:tetratricopeptide (TPR) repeat protein